MKKMISRSYVVQPNRRFDRTNPNGLRTVKDYFFPEVEHQYTMHGLDSELELGRKDLEDLGYPKRIKVVIHVLDR